MRLASIISHGRRTVGLISADFARVWPLEDTDMLELIARPAHELCELEPTGSGLPVDSVKIEAPLPAPRRNLFCVGKNYRAHAREFARSGVDSSADGADEIPSHPVIFTKAAACVIAHGEEIRYPHGLSDKVDYEAELAVVIGKPGRRIPAQYAYDHVFGYTILNDVTARDLQHRHKQWFIGKSLETFCPMGPWLVTADEVDAANLSLRCWVNDELRQSANTRDLIFDIPTLIQTLSAGLALQPGDVIATGTPAGVGLGFTPPKYLQPGDQVAVEIEGLGRLVNRVA